MSKPKKPQNPEHISTIIERELERIKLLQDDPSDWAKFAVADPSIYPEIVE